MKEFATKLEEHYSAKQYNSLKTPSQLVNFAGIL